MIVMMQRNHRALLQQNARDHDVCSHNHLSAEERIKRFDRNIVPLNVRCCLCEG